MGEFPRELPDVLFTLVGIAFLVGFLIVLPLIHALAMKWAVNLAGGGPIGVFRGLCAAGATGVAAGTTHWVMTSWFGDASGWILGGYASVGAIAAIALVAPCNPLSAAAAYVLYSLLGTLGTFSAGGMFALVLLLATGSQTLETHQASGPWTSSAGAAEYPGAPTLNDAGPGPVSASTSSGAGGSSFGAVATPAGGASAASGFSAAPETTGRPKRRSERGKRRPEPGGVWLNPYVTD